MGIASGSTLIESNFSLPRDMIKVNDIDNKIFFGSNATEEINFSDQFDMMSSNIQHRTTEANRFAQIFTTVKGNVLTIPTSLNHPALSGAVDLRIDKPADIIEEQDGDHQKDENILRNSFESSSDDEGSNSILKFGIESILKSEVKLQSKQNSSSIKVVKQKSDVGPRTAVDEQKTEKPFRLHDGYNEQREKFAKDEKANKSTDTKLDRAKFAKNPLQPPSSLSRKNIDPRFRPYAKVTFGRSQSDPAKRPVNNITLNNKIERMISESETQKESNFSHQLTSSPFTVFEATKYRIFSNDSDTTRPSSSLDGLAHHLPANSKELSKGSFRIAKALELDKLQPLDNDEVFKDNTDPTRNNIAAIKNVQKFLQQRNKCPIPTSQNFFSTLEKQKYGSIGYFPSYQPLAGMPPTSPTNFNLPSWSGISNNCHPVFRNFFNPYTLYNQSTAAAVAYMNSFKSMPHQPMLSPTSPHLSTSPTNGHFSFHVSENDHCTEDGIDCGSRKKKRWSRAVFSPLQRQSLEESFKRQKYVAKPERRYLAETLGLTDAQVKIWFQNRRMKWRQEQRNRRIAATNENLLESGEDTFSQVQSCCSV